MRKVAKGLATGLVVLGAGVAAGGCDAQSGAGLNDARLGVMIDSLLPGIAEASGLPVRRPVRYAMQSRDSARAFIERQLDEELGPAELGGMERAYRAFGLLPDTLDLRTLLLDLLTEQVVGYYDPPTDRLYVLEGASAELAEPVVAHELVHALQDQTADLDSLVARERGNDRQMAAQAAAEGQAMLVMLALQAARTTGGPVDPGALPDLESMMRPALEAENEQFPVFQRSPRLIKETLLFPYVGGASFVQALFRRREGAEVPVPFGDRLPQSTEQVLDPAGAFFGEPDAPTELELGAVAEGWSVVYENTLGQLEVSILLDEHGGGEAAAAATGWDGDRYGLLEGPGGEEALVWYSVWDDAASADRFGDAYRSALGRRPGRRGTVDRLEVEGRAVVRVVETGTAVSLEEVPVPELASLAEVAAR